MHTKNLNLNFLFAIAFALNLKKTPDYNLTCEEAVKKFDEKEE